MKQAPGKGEEPCLPQGQSMVSIYTGMTTGSRHVTIVINNQTDVPIIIGKGIKVMVAANRVPSVAAMSGTLEKLDKMQGFWQIRMYIECRKETLFQQLDLSGLEGWPSTNHAFAHTLLTEYHDIFSS